MLKNLKEVLKAPNIEAGYLYFYVHFVCEVVCFYMLAGLIGDSAYLWLCPLIYDALAFVPQGIIGYISDKFPRIKMGLIGVVLLCLAIFISKFEFLKYLPIIIVAIGNAFIHVNGAEVTLRASNGKLSHSAIFVAGGSFGVITGKILFKYLVSPVFVFLLCLTSIPFIMLAEYYRTDADKLDSSCSNFNYANPNISIGVIIFLTTFVVFVRSYMGYGIPTAWNKTLFQSIILYVSMGIGKALGGILSDLIGIRKVALISTLLSIPFLIIGENLMIVSVIGIMLFSMTMAVTLGILVSKLKKTPGLAFGYTTIGLFLGFLQIFFVKFSYGIINNIIIILLAIISFLILQKVLKKGGDV